MSAHEFPGLTGDQIAALIATQIATVPLLAPASSSRNVIQPSGNYTALSLLRNASGSTANTFVIGDENGGILTNFTAAGNLHIGGDISGRETYGLTVQGTLGGMSLRRTSTSEPFIILDNNTANSGAQLRGLNAGGFRITDQAGSLEWFIIQSGGLTTVRGLNTNTNGITNVFTLEQRLTSGTPAAGMGAAYQFTAQTSGTGAGNGRLLGRLRMYWNDPDQPNRKSRGVLSGADTSERDVIGWGANGSASLLGFHDKATAPIAQPVLATGAGASVDNVITVLQNLGLVRQS